MRCQIQQKWGATESPKRHLITRFITRQSRQAATSDNSWSGTICLRPLSPGVCEIPGLASRGSHSSSARNNTETIDNVMEQGSRRCVIRDAHLQTDDVSAEERSKFPPTSRSLAFVTMLVIEYVRLDLNLSNWGVNGSFDSEISATHSLVDVPVLKLNKARADGGDVALLVGERHSPCTFRILEIGVNIYSGVADASVQTVHDHRKLHCNNHIRTRFVVTHSDTSASTNKRCRGLPAFNGRGTPPTKIVFRGSRGWERSKTKSLSVRFQGRI